MEKLHSMQEGCCTLEHSVSIWGLLAVSVLALMFLSCDGREQTYKGRTAREWISQLKQPAQSDTPNPREALIAMGNDAVPALAEAIDRHKPKRTFYCLEILGSIGGKEAVSVLSDAVYFLPDYNAATGLDLNKKAIEALGETKHSEALAVLVELLKRGMVTTRNVGVFANFGEEAVDPLLQLLADKNPDIRGCSAKALGMVGPRAKRAVESLRAALKDESEDVRSAAILALGRIGPAAASAVPDLIKLMGKRNGSIGALGKIGPSAKEAVPTLIHILRDREIDWEIRSAAVRSLGLIGANAKSAIPALEEIIEEFKSPNSAVRSDAVSALKKIRKEQLTGFTPSTGYSTDADPAKPKIAMDDQEEGNASKWAGNETIEFCGKTILSGEERIVCEDILVKDITALAKMTNTKYLFLTGTAVSDIAPLKNLKSLENVNLARTRVTDLTPLSGLNRLKILSLMDSKVTNIGPLQNLASLKRLNLFGSEVADLTPISGLSGLETLDIRATKVKDLKPLKNLSSLRALYIGRTEIKDLTPLSNLKRLEFLSLYKNHMINVGPLANVTSLKSLQIKESTVRSILPLKKLKGLELLDLTGTEVEQGQLEAIKQEIPSCVIKGHGIKYQLRARKVDANIPGEQQNRMRRHRRNRYR